MTRKIIDVINSCLLAVSVCLRIYVYGLLCLRTVWPAPRAHEYLCVTRVRPVTLDRCSLIEPTA